MKKVSILILSILAFLAAIGSSFYFCDRTAPEIEIKSTPILNEQSSYENLIDYAEAYDENLKSFFIENTNVTEIIDKKQVTYVAIDKSNNITKLKTRVDIDPDYTTYHIVCIQEPIIQVNTRFNVDDFFELQNECGIKIDDNLRTSGIDTSKAGTYVIEVCTNSYPCDPLQATITVTDKFAPVITLKKDTIDYYTNTYWSDNDFLSIIDNLDDDVDSSDYLLENINIDWRDVLQAQADGYVTITGTYAVTYTVTDSDNNIAQATVEVILDQPILQEESVGE